MTYVLEFFGDLPSTPGLDKPQSFATLEEALQRIESLFLKPAGQADCYCLGCEGHVEETGSHCIANLPDIEDDRILVWKADPDAESSMRVVWAFNGWHWQSDEHPGMEDANDVLPTSGISLYQICNFDAWN